MGADMEPRVIDLAQVNWPFCLLELKSALEGMSQGEVLEVTVSDPVVLSTMVKVLHSSPDRVMGTSEKGPLFVLTVEKG